MDRNEIVHVKLHRAGIQQFFVVAKNLGIQFNATRRKHREHLSMYEWSFFFHDSRTEQQK